MGNDYTMFCPNNLTQINMLANKMHETNIVLNVEIVRCKPTQFIQCISDGNFYSYFHTTQMALFVQTNSVMLDSYQLDPNLGTPNILLTEYYKVFEQQIDFVKLEQVRVVLEINEVTQYDNLGMNILSPTFTW